MTAGERRERGGDETELPYLIEAHLRHMRRRNLSPASISQRRRVLLRLDAELDVDLAEATLEDLEVWQDRVAARVTASSVRTYVANVAGFYAWAVRYEFLDKDPTLRLVRPRSPSTIPRPIPEPDLAAALRLAPGYLRPMLVLASFVGLRVSEIAAVRREDVIRDPAGVFLLVHGKGGKERLVALVGEVLDELSPWFAGGRGALFPGYDGKRVSETVSAHMRQIGMPYTAHQLRHRFGTRLYGATRDLRLVQQVMGHTSERMTAGYVEVGGATSAEGMALISYGLTPQSERLAALPDRFSGPPATN